MKRVSKESVGNRVAHVIGILFLVAIFAINVYIDNYAADTNNTGNAQNEHVIFK